ncbi:class I SAM-dependent methyltransferase [Nonomuraea rubra]|uniref:class I SAM-dependent methyltransferase n=1 Tax=Nonomuraea rubra TaxID=46180 RepID=UPI0033E99F73
MRDAQPSQTALMAAASRAAYTERLLGDRFEQYVVLGAGLDTFALRCAPGGPPTRVIEVDHPATQRWKRELMTAAGLASPDGLVFAPVDFESGDLMAALRAAGLDPERPALVSWLGVAMYLTEEAIAATLAVLGRLPRGSELVMEYALPPGLQDERGAEYASFALAAADRGEPWLSFFAPDDLSALLKQHGLEVVEHVRQAGRVTPGLWRRQDALRPADLCRLTRAIVTG